MKASSFWFLCSSLLLLLLGIYLRQGFQRKNLAFVAWLLAGCGSFLVAYIGLSLGRPWWFDSAHRISDLVGASLAVTVICFGIARWDCPVNRTLALALAGMLGLQLFGIYAGRELPSSLRTWLANIAFFGPTLWMLFVFSNTRFDRLINAVTSGEWRVARTAFEAARRVINV